MPDISSIYEDLIVSSKPTVKHLELSDVYGQANQMRTIAREAVANMQERAMNNIKARNELAVQLSELNAAPGADVDADRLYNAVNEVNAGIDSFVEKEGNWVTADKEIMRLSTAFATNENVKSILKSSQEYQTYVENMKQNSDANAQYQALFAEMSIKSLNAAGGSNKLQSFSDFAIHAGKGFDMKVYQDKILTTYDKLKSDGRYFLKEENRQVLTKILNDPNADNELKGIAQELIDFPVSGHLTVDVNSEYITPERMMRIAKYIVDGDTDFKIASQLEASANLYAQSKLGKNAKDILLEQYAYEARNDTDANKIVLQQTEAYKNANSDKAREKILNGTILVSESDYMETIGRMFNLNQANNETYEQYDNRLSSIYASSYTEAKLADAMNYASALAFNKEAGNSKLYWFTKGLTGNTASSKKAVDKAKFEWNTMKYSKGSVPAGAYVDAYNNTINQTAKAIKDIDSNIALLQNTPQSKDRDDRIKELVKMRNDYTNYISDSQIQAQHSYMMADDATKKEVAINTLYDIVTDESFWQQLGKASLLSVIGAGGISAQSVAGPLLYSNGDLKEDITKFVNSEFDKGTLKDGSWLDLNDFNSISILDRLFATKFGDKSFKQKYLGDDASFAIKETKDENDNIDYELGKSLSKFVESRYKHFNKALSNKGIGLDAHTIFYVGSESSEQGTPLSEAENILLSLIFNTPNGFDGILHQVADDNGNLKEKNKLNGAPFNSNDLYSLFMPTYTKGKDNEKIYNMGDVRIMLGIDENGETLIRLTKPIQGTSKTVQTVLLKANNDTIQEAIDNYYKDIILNAEAKGKDEGQYRTYYKTLAENAYIGQGASIKLGYDNSNLIQRNMSDMVNYNNVKGVAVSNLSQAFKVINATVKAGDEPINLFANGMNIMVTRQKNGTWKVALNEMIKGNWSPVGNDEYKSYTDMRNDVFSIMGKIRNSEFIANEIFPGYTAIQRKQYLMRYKTLLQLMENQNNTQQ